MVTIPAQFNGPDHSGNGGYVAGLLAAQLGGGVVTSTLRVPPPLDVALSFEHDTGPDGADSVRLLTAGGAVVATASPGEFVREPPEQPTAAEAETGLAHYPGFRSHPFDHCFTCGTAREAGDGLRLFTGPIGNNRVAGPWSPHGAFVTENGGLDVPTTWAALDCPGGWSADFTRQLMVLGRMTAVIHRAPRTGEACLSVGSLSAQEGRKLFTDTALYSAEGELLGHAEQIWIEVQADSFQ